MSAFELYSLSPYLTSGDPYPGEYKEDYSRDWSTLFVFLLNPKSAFQINKLNITNLNQSVMQ